MAIPVLLFFSALILSSCAQDCRPYTTCTECLSDPRCGWCTSLGDCVPGTANGPTHGTCAAWDFYRCNAPPPTPTPTPTPTPPPPASGSWITFGGSVRHDGYRAVSFSSTAKPALSWRGSFGGTASSASVVASSTIYGCVPVGSEVFLVGLSLNNGSIVSKINLGQMSSYGAPSVSEDGSLIAVQTVGPNEGMYTYVYSSKNKAVAWVGGGGSQWANYPYGPLITSDNNVYYLDGEYNGEISAYRGNGTTLFDVSLYSTDAGCDSSTPSAWPGTNNIYWTTAPGESSTAAFGAIDALTGTAKYTVNLNATWDGYSTYTVPVIAEAGIGLVTSRAGVLWLNAIRLDGVQMWTASCTMPQANDYSPATDGKTVALACANNIATYEIMSGKLLRYYACVGCSGQPILTDSHIFVNSRTGVVMIDRSSGSQVTVSSTPGTIALAGSTLLVTTSSGTVEAYALSTAF